MTDAKRLGNLVAAMRNLADRWMRDGDAMRKECARELRAEIEKQVQR